jgi:hypothetical protein
LLIGFKAKSVIALREIPQLGLEWKHIDWNRGVVMVRQRFYRGDLDVPKTRKAKRDLPRGQLVDHLRRIWPGPGHENDFVFIVKSRKAYAAMTATLVVTSCVSRRRRWGCITPVSVFPAFRREAITAITASAGVGKAMNAFRTFKIRNVPEYTLVDLAAQERAVNAFQDRILSKPGEDACPRRSIEMGQNGPNLFRSFTRKFRRKYARS